MIKGKFFPSQEKEEKIFLLIRKHWFNYIIFFIMAGLVILPIIALIIYVNTAKIELTGEYITIAVVLISVYLLLLLGVLLYGFVDYYLDVYIVTDRRVVDIVQKGLFKRKISELHLHQIQDVSAHVEGISQTLLHFGDVYIQTAGERENFLFQSIPHPYTVAKEIIDLHEKQLGRRNKKDSSPINYDEQSSERGLSASKQRTGSEDLILTEKEAKDTILARDDTANSSGKNQVIEKELTEGREVEFK